MPRACTICTHPEHEEIDRLLVAGELALRNIAGRYGTSATALHRHKKDHIAQALTKAKEAHEVALADTLLEQVQDLQRKTLTILRKAEDDSKYGTALRAIKEARHNMELVAKLIGQLDESTKIAVGVSVAGESTREEKEPSYDLSVLTRNELGAYIAIAEKANGKLPADHSALMVRCPDCGNVDASLMSSPENRRLKEIHRIQARQ